LDFGEIAAMAEGSVTSVVIFRLQNTRADQLIQRLSETLARKSGFGDDSRGYLC
jgi:hypothetical protein